MSAPSPRLLEWIRKRRVDMTERGLITRVELWHAVDGEGGQRLENFDLAERDEDEDVDDLTIEIWNAAEEDALTRPQGSYQRYVVMLFRGEDDKEAEESRAFTIQGAMLSNYLGGSDPPNERGLLGQDLRQRNEMHALMLRMAEGMAGGMERQLKSEREWSLNLEVARRKHLELEQNMLDRSEERALARAEQQKKEERLDMVVNTLLGLAPMVLSKLFEQKPTPAATAGPAPSSGAPPAHSTPPASTDDRTRRVVARDLAVSNVLGTLTTEQMQTIASTLRPDQAMTFIEIYSSYQEDQQARSANTKPRAAPRSTPEDFSHGEDIHGSETH